MKATNLKEVINYFDSQKPLNPVDEDEWNSFYIDTGRKEIQKIVIEFNGKPIGHKILFGGHSGNGKSTELNRLVSLPEIKDKFSVIIFDVNEVLNPNDINIVELLLAICLKLLEFAEGKVDSLPDHIEDELMKLEDFFHDKLEIERSKNNSIQTEAGASVKGSVGVKLPFLKMATTIFAKMKAQHESRVITREKYRPRLTEIVELIQDLIVTINSSKAQSPVLIIIDGLDRVPFDVAEKLFVDDGQNIAMIKNSSMLLTVPISIIHSIKSAQIKNIIGTIRPLTNIMLKTKDGDICNENIDRLKKCVLNRMDKELIEDEAISLAIKYSGGVFRTLIHFIASAAVNSKVFNGTIIDKASMEEAIREARIEKSRTLTKKHLDLMLEIHNNKSFISSLDNERLELLHGLFVLEYINGDEWSDINPLLKDRIEDYKKKNNASKE